MSEDGIKVIEAVEQKIDKVRTRTLDISFNELLDMHRNGELVINPDYQRLFRWSKGKQSRFIESLILEMPVPPIYVIERDEAKYELIDGLQRISSYLHFRGELTTEEDDGDKFLALTDCDIVTDLNDLTFNDLPRSLQIKLKRSFVRVEVIRKESDERLRYYMFKRLNTGGESLSDQEVRNCTVRLLDNRFNDFIIELSDDEHFKECVATLSEEKLEKKFDQELVLRFFAFKNWRDHYYHDLGDFMTEYMEAVSDSQRDNVDFDYIHEEAVFQKTFRILAKTLGENSFSRLTPKGKPISAFSPYHYEAFTVGLQPFIDSISLKNKKQLERVHSALMKVKAQADFISLTQGGGKNYVSLSNKRISLVEEALAKGI